MLAILILENIATNYISINSIEIFIGRMPKQDPHQEMPEYYHIKILEGMRQKNLHEIQKNIKMGLERAIKFTEEVLNKRHSADSAKKKNGDIFFEGYNSGQ